MTRKRVAILISGRGSNMAALIEAAKDPDYPAEIALVLSNRPDAAGLTRADSAAIPTSIVDHSRHGKDREAFERALRRCAQCAPHRPDLPGRLHAAAHALVRRPLGGPDAQHPSGAASGLQGARHPRARARGRREDPRRERPLRRAGDGFRADRRPGRGAGARRRHRGDAGGARARGRAPHLSARAPAGRGGPRARRRRALHHRWRFRHRPGISSSRKFDWPSRRICS